MTAPSPLPPLAPPDLVRALAAVRDAWLRSPLPPAARAALEADTGWRGAHLDEAVRRAFAPFTDAALARLENGDRHHFVPVETDPSRTSNPQAFRSGNGACPHFFLLAIVAGRIPAPAASAMFHALAARVPILLKPPAAAPAFARLLVASVARAAPALAPSVALLDVPGGDPALDAAVRTAPACLVHGSDATVAAVLAARDGLPTFPGAHRESVAIAFREARVPGRLPALARALARDVAIYDQSGCLSPVAVLVEDPEAPRPGAPSRDLAARLFDALLAQARRWPPGAPTLPDAAAIRAFAEESRLVARASGGRLFPDRGPVPPVLSCAPGPLRPGPGFRSVQVVPFATPGDLAAALAPLAGRLQGVAIAGPRARWTAFLAAHPAFRPAWTTTPGRLQRPPADWPENGIVLSRELRRLVGKDPGRG